jgi:hypothetical protein
MSNNNSTPRGVLSAGTAAARGLTEGGVQMMNDETFSTEACNQSLDDLVDFTLPLYFLGTPDTGYLGLDAATLMFWTEESRIRGFMRRGNHDRTMCAEFTMPIPVLDFLEFMKAVGIKELLDDPLSLQQQGFSAVWIDDLIDVIRNTETGTVGV